MSIRLVMVAPARLLGGDPGSDMSEDEHGRIYVLFPAEGAVGTLVLRY